MALSAARIERADRAATTADRAVHADADYRPSYGAAAIATSLVFLLYLVTLSPSTAMWDASEYIAAAYVLGIPHPPGNPFFVLLGHVFGSLPLPMSYAAKINVLAALCSAVSAGMWFLITERVLVSWLPQRWMRLAGAGVAALIGAAAFTVWNQSVVNEKVYTVSLVFFAIVSWLTVLWADDPYGRRADRILVLIAFLIGLGYTNHPAGFLVAPAVGVAVLVRRWQTLLRWRLILACVAALGFGLTPFLYQPIRAAHFPAINEGEPTACKTEIGVACTFDKLTYTRFMANVNREQYGKPDLSVRQAPFTAQVGMWWLYFKWQWLRDAHDENPGPQAALAAVFLLLGVMGGYVHYKRDRRSFSFFGPLMFTVTLVLIYYMNFKYGYSQAPELGDAVPREVRDRDYFYLWSFSAWSVWAALGLVFVWEGIAALIGKDRVEAPMAQEGPTTATTTGGARAATLRELIPHPRHFAMAAPILLFAALPLGLNWKQASRAGHTDTRDFAHDLLNSVEPYSVLVTVGDNDTFPLWYAQEVEGIRKDVVIANTSLLNTDWYPRQLVRRPVYAYDAAAGPAVYRNTAWVKPDGPPVDLTFEQLDAVPTFEQLAQPQLFQKGELRAVIDPRQLQNGVLEKADVFILRSILDGFPERPVYFSRTAGGYPHSLGLGRYLLTQGLARKLMPTEVTAGRDTVQIPGEGFLDLVRTRRLWDSVFVAPASIIRRGDWVDKPSVGIPYLYVTTGAILAEALARTGDVDASNRVMARAEAVAKATRLDALFGDQTERRGPVVPLTGDSQTAVPLGPAPAAPAAPAAP